MRVASSAKSDIVRSGATVEEGPDSDATSAPAAAAAAAGAVAGRPAAHDDTALAGSDVVSGAPSAFSSGLTDALTAQLPMSYQLPVDFGADPGDDASSCGETGGVKLEADECACATACSAASSFS